MSAKDDLIEFTQAALKAGQSRDDIAHALTSAGWSPGESRDALDAWAETPFAVPVPRPRSTVSARDFFIYALIFGALITAAICLTNILMDVIDMMFDDDFNRWQMRGLRSTLAGLLVAGPIYIWLTVREERRIAVEPGAHRSAIRKWMIYLLLLITATTFLGDLIWLLGRFLNGELTVPFVLKSGVVGVMAAGIFMFYSDVAGRTDGAPVSAPNKGETS